MIQEKTHQYYSLTKHFQEKGQISKQLEHLDEQIYRLSKGKKDRSILESVLLRFNQIIDVFKTGKWAVDNQTREQLTQKLKKYEDLSQKWKEHINTNDIAQINNDIKIREKLNQRLLTMKKTVRQLKYRNDKNVKSRNDNFKELETSINQLAISNKNIIQYEKALKMVSKGKLSIKEAKLKIKSLGIKLESKLELNDKKSKIKSGKSYASGSDNESNRKKTTNLREQASTLRKIIEEKK